MCPPDPQRAHHRQMQRLHLIPCLPGSPCPFAPCSWLPCSATRVFSPGDLLPMIWSTWRGVPGVLANILDATPAPLKSSHIVVLWPGYKRMPPWMVVPYRSVLRGAQVFRYCVSICRQLRLPTSRSKRQQAWCCLGGWPVLGKGIRTGGRPHPGLAGKRPPKQRPKPCSCFRRPRALPRRRSWFLERRLWVFSSQRGVLCPGCKLGASRLPWIPATTFPPPCSTDPRWTHTVIKARVSE